MKLPLIIDGVEYIRAELGIDGNYAFALLGPNIQEGESELVELSSINSPCAISSTAQIACQRALKQLRKRLNLPNLSYYLGKSHPNFVG